MVEHVPKDLRIVRENSLDLMRGLYLERIAKMESA